MERGPIKLIKSKMKMNNKLILIIVIIAIITLIKNKGESLQDLIEVLRKRMVII